MASRRVSIARTRAVKAQHGVDEMGMVAWVPAGLTGGLQAWSDGPGDWATGRVEEGTLGNDDTDKWKKWKGSMHVSAGGRGLGGLGGRGSLWFGILVGHVLESLVAKSHDATTPIVCLRRAIDSAGMGFSVLQRRTVTRRPYRLHLHGDGRGNDAARGLVVP
ncbi:hypothetical protein G7Z17_g9195 [Cylindrodendrum hubeiense]|uniref:Uncharacterized protein n=1 Tax=Cylindrodendrum hubeiense TaxID=595255 RepID=A0A9P5GZY3_9HYPO|nr:hypothetical protein G7Z17_g9195 [Cylindrodendrum hubeiense]